MTELTSFEYPDHETATLCERHAGDIRRIMATTIYNVAEIGRLLQEVKDTLPHGMWGAWVEHHLDWSEETTRKYRLLALAVDDNPRILEFRSVELATRFPMLPERTQQEILETNAVRHSDAKAIIERHKAEDWREVVDRLMENDPGAAYHSIEQALDTNLRPEALDALEEHKETFALLSGRDPSELLKEAGMTVRNRFRPMEGRPNVMLQEDGGNCSFLLWNSGNPTALVVVPAQKDPVKAAWAADAILALCEKWGIK